MSPATPTDYEVPPTAKLAFVRRTSSGRNGALPSGDDDNSRSGADSDTEYGSVVEFIEPVTASANVSSPVSRSSNTDRDIHLGQLMESVL